jgi:hypothetical protein
MPQCTINIAPDVTREETAEVSADAICPKQEPEWDVDAAREKRCSPFPGADDKLKRENYHSGNGEFGRYRRKLATCAVPVDHEQEQREQSDAYNEPDDSIRSLS